MTKKDKVFEKEFGRKIPKDATAFGIAGSEKQLKKELDLSATSLHTKGAKKLLKKRLSIADKHDFTRVRP
jgi:F0F1-type ATP synthase membrane subunit b/b'